VLAWIFCLKSARVRQQTRRKIKYKPTETRDKYVFDAGGILNKHAQSLTATLLIRVWRHTRTHSETITKMKKKLLGGSNNNDIARAAPISIANLTWLQIY